MKKRIMTLWLLLMMAALVPTAYGQIIMGSQPLVGDIDDEPREFYDPGGTGPFGTNLRDTMTLKTNMSHTVLYVLFEEFAMTERDTLWIFNGENTNAPLLGIYHLVSSPGEIVASGKSMTFVFHSDNEEIPGLTEGWKATVYAYDTIPDNISFGDGHETVVKCLAEFYDSGGPNGNIANNNENPGGTTFTEFTSPIGTHIKCVFDQFSVNGRLEIWDGQYYANRRLIGQFCTSTLDNSTQNRPPVLYSSENTLTFIYYGSGGDQGKAGWHATITCVPTLAESDDDNPCPQVVNVPGGMYSDVDNPHVIEYDCSNPVVLLEAQPMGIPGRYANDYTVKPLEYNEETMWFGYDVGDPIPWPASVTNRDDKWCAPVELPFVFTFFGQPYTTVYPSANGIISFNPHDSWSFCEWSTSVPQAHPPYQSEPNRPYNYANCAYLLYEDINPQPSSCSLNGSIKYGVAGDPPCRAFVFNYNNIGLYQCCSQGANYYNTYQMVLWEGTNVIDVYIKKRNTCSWNGGRGVIGLQNKTSSQILTVPGRDFNQTWTAQTEAWRFTPIAPPDENAELTWYVDTVDQAHVISYDNHAKNRVITVSPSQTTLYISEYKYRNANNTQFTRRDTTKVLVRIPEVDAITSTGTDPICPNDPANLSFQYDETLGIAPERYKWSSGDTTATCTVNPSTTTTYFLTVTYENGCQKSDSVKVLITDLEFPTITGTDTICKGKSATLTATHPSSNDFQWSNGQTGPTITVSPQVTTDYIVSATMIGNCIVTDTFTVTVLPLPQPAFQPSPTQIFVENGIGTVTCTNLTPGDNQLHWNFGDVFSNINEVDDIENPSHDYTRAGYYTITLTATDSAGCVDSIKNRVTVEVPYFFYIPNSFTPDGDGLNEYFAPQGQGVDPDSYSMQIFDRSGMLIFSTRNPFDYWDGRNKYGQICPEGVYVYIIRLRNQNFEDKEYTGSVTLIK
jgi:gliding motility-associated-like protein